MTERVAVFVSGTGRHLENLARRAREGELDVEVVLALADREGIAALERARRFEVPTVVLDPRREADEATFSEAAFSVVEESGATTVLLAGFLRKLVLPESWSGRVLNVHPSLLPAFGGKGYWGARVHRAVLERGCTVSGATVHYVDAEYDHGPILLQRACGVLPDDDPESLAARVFEVELELYPDALRLHLERT